MRVIFGFTFGTVATMLATSYLMPAQTNTETVIETRTVTNQVLTTLDLEELRGQIAGLAEELRDECIRVLERTSDLPLPMIEAYVDRHYLGDACAAADEVWARGW
jgi:hypothetical protein